MTVYWQFLDRILYTYRRTPLNACSGVIDDKIVKF